MELFVLGVNNIDGDLDTPYPGKHDGTDAGVLVNERVPVNDIHFNCNLSLLSG